MLNVVRAICYRATEERFSRSGKNLNKLATIVVEANSLRLQAAAVAYLYMQVAVL